MPTFPFTHNRLTRRLDVLVKGRLWLQVLIALALGIGAGLMLGPDLGLVTPETAETVGDWLALPGKLFLALIRMVIIPLAVSSIILGMAGGGGGETLKLVGRRLAFFILVTTIAATAIGASLAQIVRPGQDVAGQDVTGGFEPMPRAKPDLGAAAASPLQEMTRGLPDLITNLITQNITAAILEQDMLAIVIFALLIGTAVIAADKRELTRPLVALAEAVLEVCMANSTP